MLLPDGISNNIISIGVFEIINFCLTFAVTGVPYQGKLKYSGQMGEPKVKFKPITIRKYLISIRNFNYILAPFIKTSENKVLVKSISKKNEKW